MAGKAPSPASISSLFMSIICLVHMCTRNRYINDFTVTEINYITPYGVI
jgi:hypothetical protein